MCRKRSIGTSPYELVYGAKAIFPCYEAIARIRGGAKWNSEENKPIDSFVGEKGGII